MRHYLIVSLLAIVTSSCATWSPDYEPDPDVALGKLLAPIKDGSRPVDTIAAERLRFSLERLAARHPSHIPSQVAAGAVALESGEPQRAQELVERALSLDPTNIEARCLRVRIAVADGSIDLARKLVTDGLRLRPDSAALYESSAWLYQMRGKMDEALADLDAADTLEAPTWRTMFHRGLIEELRGEYGEARKHYQATLVLNDKCRQARQRLAGLVALQRVNSRR